MSLFLTNARIKNEKVKVSFDTWIQLLGMLGVLGGLVLLTGECSNLKKAIAGQIQARNQMLLDNQLAFLGKSRLLGKYYLKAIQPLLILRLLVEKNLQFSIKSYKHAQLHQNAFQQYQLDLLPDDVWEQATERISNHWRNCHIRPIWYTTAVPSFQRYLDALPKECVSIFPQD